MLCNCNKYDNYFLVVKKYSTFVSIRRIDNPFEKKTHILLDKFPILQIKKSATNLFLSFYFNGRILFSCSAGSAGLIKKERRRKHAAYAIGIYFCKFVRYYYRTKKTFSPFRNIIVLLRAPVSFFRLFIKSFRSLYYTFFSSFFSKYLKRRNYLRTKLLFFCRIFNRKYNSFLQLIRNIHNSRINFLCTFFFHSIIKLLYSVYNCSISQFCKSYFFSFFNSKKSTSFLFSFSTFFTFLKKQHLLSCNTISNPPKHILFNYFHKYFDVFSYLRKMKRESFKFNNFFLDKYFSFKNELFVYSLEVFFSIVDGFSYSFNNFSSLYINKLSHSNMDQHFFYIYPFVSMFDFFSDFNFSFFSNFNTFSFFLKYAYLDNSFFFSSSMIKFFFFKINLNCQINLFNDYFFVFIKRLFFSFLFFFYKKTSFFSSNVSLYFRFFFNRLVSFSFYYFVDFIYSNNDSLFFNIRHNIIYFPFVWSFSLYNIWLYNSLFFFSLSDLSSSATFLYYLWLKQQLRMFFFFLLMFLF